MTKLWNVCNTTINADLTILLSKTGMKKRNNLDASSTTEQAFRTKIINQQLPTLDLRKNTYKHDITDMCPRCDKKETFDHIWECKDTRRQFTQLMTVTETNLKNGKNQSTDWRKLQLDPYTIKTIKKILNMTDIEFITSPEAKGIIRTTIVDRIRSEMKQFNMNTKYHLLYVLDAWSRAFYEIIWMKRTQLVKTINRDYLNNKCLFTNRERKLMVESPMDKTKQNRIIKEKRNAKRFKLTHDATNYFTVHERNLFTKTPKPNQKRNREEPLFTVRERNLFRKSPKPPDIPRRVGKKLKLDL
jgi:hypothetical protein